jgi:uncharacterized membrane protein
MPRRRKLAMLVLSACFIATTSALTFAQDGRASGKCTFQQFKIPAPAGSNPNTVALNDKGAMVGDIRTSPQHIAGFLFSGGKFTHFMFPGSANTLVHDINNFGVIVGSFDTAGGNGQRAFMVHSGGFHEIKIPGFPNAPAIATGVNDQGDITGQFNGNGSDWGFLLHKGKLTILSFPGAKGGTFPTGINNLGEIVGSYLLFSNDIRHGFSWKNGVFANIRTPSGGNVNPFQISNRGDIVGDFLDANFQGHGFSLEDKGRFTQIDVPNTLASGVIAVNSSDQVLAAADITSGTILVKGSCSSAF